MAASRQKSRIRRSSEGKSTFGSTGWYVAMSSSLLWGRKDAKEGAPSLAGDEARAPRCHPGLAPPGYSFPSLPVGRFYPRTRLVPRKPGEEDAPVAHGSEP